MRAILNKYFPRSAGGSFDQVFVYAFLAAVTARFTSARSAYATFDSTSSVAGLVVMKVFPDFAATNFPLINRPYSLLISTNAADSGAGAY